MVDSDPSLGERRSRPDAEVAGETALDQPFLPSWGVHLQPCGGLFVDRESLYYLRMSGLALELALQIARTRNVEGVVEIRRRLTRQPPELVSDDLETLLGAHPVTASWLTGALNGPLRITGSTDAYLPLIASLQLTNRCNLSCSFCYASSGDPLPGELETPEWMKVIERLATAGVANLTLTGGEPTLARDFADILTAASALIDNVDIFTNGLAWSTKTIGLVAALPNVRCQVSVDGREEHHDALRGRPGSYRAALSTIRRLADADVPVVVAMTVSPLNHGDVETVMADVAAAGARMFRAGTTVPVGRGRDKDFGLSGAQYRDVTEQFAARSHGDGMEVVGWDSCSSQAEEFSGLGLPVEFLTPGYLSWHVRSDGWVTPCQVEETPLGHILGNALSEIGDPVRLAGAQRQAVGCTCLRKIQRPSDHDLPFGLRSPDGAETERAREPMV